MSLTDEVVISIDVVIYCSALGEAMNFSRLMALVKLCVITWLVRVRVFVSYNIYIYIVL